MVASAPLVITPAVVAALHELRDRAAKHPVDMLTVMKQIETPAGLAAHKELMTAQTIQINGPYPFFVTYSVETNHPVGTCRHMSMSIVRSNRVPSPEAVWMVATELGFVGSIADCTFYPEDLSDKFGGVAVNLVQPIDIHPAQYA